MNEKLRKYLPILGIALVAVVAVVVVGTGQDDDPGDDTEITLPLVTTKPEPSGAATSQTALVSGATGAVTTVEAPVSVLTDSANGVEADLRAKYEAVRKSRNVCGAIDLLFTIPDPALILSDEFGKSAVKEYIDLWKKLWADLEDSGPADAVSAMKPLAGAFERIFAAIEDADYSTSVLATEFQGIMTDSPELPTSVAKLARWRGQNCPSETTFTISD